MSEALEYARRGWLVFPCYGAYPAWGGKAVSCSCPLGVKCPDIGKHPACAHGFLDATRDEAVIRAWRLGLNLAIATGAHSGLFVVDVDPRNDGWATLAKLEREQGPFARDAVVATGGGGLHFYFQYPRKGAPIESGGGVFGAGVDLKGDGGYVVAPPSRHLSLNYYHWLRGMPPKLPIAPAWLLKMARSAESSRSADRTNRPSIKTTEHPTGQALAKLLNARDCGTYWKFDCPARAHKTPDAAMYPHDNGGIYFVCYSTNPCSDIQIREALRGLRNGR